MTPEDHSRQAFDAACTVGPTHRAAFAYGYLASMLAGEASAPRSTVLAVIDGLNRAIREGMEDGLIL